MNGDGVNRIIHEIKALEGAGTKKSKMKPQTKFKRGSIKGLWHKHYLPSGINSFVKNALPGMKHPISGVVDVLELIYNTHPQDNFGLSLAVSHDTILAAIVAVISGNKQIEQSDWPEMMEGLFVWFEGENFSNSKLKWIWRGQKHELVIKDFQNK